MAKNANPVRGTRDILPEEMALRDQLEGSILKTYTAHGFQRIETPALESLDLLLDSEGGENLKMLFTVLKRGEKLRLDEQAGVLDLCDIGLRYDLTLPLSRFYSNNQQHLTMPFKAIQIGNVYRAERPQKGRFRSFKQCDIDIIGEESWHAEVELIDTTAKALQEIGFQNFSVRINDRRILTGMMLLAGYKEDQMAGVSIILDKMDKIGKEGVLRELSEIEPGGKAAEELLRIAGDLSLETLKGYSLDPHVIEGLTGTMEAMRTLASGTYDVVFDPTLVRGMGYYTGMIFEVAYGPYGFSIAGGGRYDGLIGKFSKQTVPAVGFSIGFERIVTILQEEGRSRVCAEDRLALLFDEGNSIAQVIEKSDALRKEGYAVSVLKAKKKLGKQIGQLESAGFTHLWIFGRDESVRAIGENHGA